MKDLRVSNSKSPAIIDGFSSVQAVRRAASRGQDPELKPKIASDAGTDSPPAEAGSEETRKAGKFARTALPEKFEVVCYECGYAFPMTGKIKETLCPRCRVTLEKRDYQLGSEAPARIKTIGTVTVQPLATLNETSITAHDMIVSGDASRATILCQSLRLRTHAALDLGKTTVRDVRVDPGQVVSLPQPLTCQNLDIHGELDAHVAIGGVVHIRPGGHLKGHVQTQHLLVDDGGGLSATLDVGPHVTVEPPTRPAFSRKDSSTPLPAPAARAPAASVAPTPRAPVRRKSKNTKPPAARK